MKGKSLSVLLILALIFNMFLTMLPVPAFATDDGRQETSGIVETCQWEIDDNGVLTFRPVDGDYGELEVYSNSPWIGNSSVKSVKVEGTVKILYSAREMFHSCTNLVTADLTGFDTSNVTDMSSMFMGCSSLNSVTFGTVDTSSVEDMYRMFDFCTGIETLDLSTFDTHNVTDMTGMFSCCYKLKNINLSSFNTEKVESFSSMFNECSSLKQIDVSGFDTAGAANFQDMFNTCESLTKLDISNFDTSNVSYASGMFDMCSSLTELRLGKWIQPEEISSAARFPMDMRNTVDGKIYEAGDFIPAGEGAVYVPDNYVEPENRHFEIGIDSNSFINSNDSKWKGSGFRNEVNYNIGRKYKEALESHLSKTQRANAAKEYYKEWGGSCAGIAATMGLVYNGLQNVSDLSYSGNETYYSMEKPYKDRHLLNVINYYHILLLVKGNQYATAKTLSKDWKDKIKDGSTLDGTEEFLRKMVEAVEEAEADNKVLIFCFNNVHSILATGYSYDEDRDKHVIELYDENTVDDTCQGEFSELVIDPDFKKVEYTVDESAGGKYTSSLWSNFWYFLTHKNAAGLLYLIDPADIECYGSTTGNKASALRSSDNTTENAIITVPVGSVFTATNANGETLSVTRTSDEKGLGDLSGSMEIYDIFFTGSGETGYVNFEVPESSSFRIDEIRGIASPGEVYGTELENDMYNDIVKVNGQNADLDITISNAGTYSSICSTGVENVTFSSDGSITVDPNVNGASTDTYEFDAFVELNGDTSAYVDVSGNSSETTNISIDGEKLNIESDDINVAKADCISNYLSETVPVSVTGEGSYSVDAEESIARMNEVTGYPISDEYIEIDDKGWVYTGKACEPYVYTDDFVEGKDFKVEYKNNVNAGKGSVIITGIGDYYGTVTKTFTISKATNPLKVSGRSTTVYYSKLKKKSLPLSVTKVIKFTRKGRGNMYYTLSSAKKGKKSYKKYFKINSSTGKVTVKRGLKKGTYTVKVKTKAKGTSNYKASSLITVTFKVKVK